MSAWEVNDGLVTRAEAVVKIQEKAKAEGLTGAFKVFYDGSLVAGASDLPEMVDMTKVRVSAKLDNA